MLYPIPEYLQDSRDGDEWAIAAVLGERVVALRYIADIAPEITQFLDSQVAFRRWLASDPVKISELNELGDVSVGFVTAEGFDQHFRLATWDPSDRL